MIDLIWKADSLHLGARYCQISKSDHKQFTRLIVLLFSSGSPIVVVGFFFQFLNESQPWLSVFGTTPR